jgi:hypothetical protein
MYKKSRKVEDIKKAIDEKYSRYWPYEKKWSPLTNVFQGLNACGVYVKRDIREI